MMDEVAGTDDYLITRALVIASLWLRHCERYSDAEEMKELLRSPRYAKWLDTALSDFLIPSP
jgi:hypothetical protein